MLARNICYFSSSQLAERESAIVLFAHIHDSALLFHFTFISPNFFAHLYSLVRLRPRQTGLFVRADARAQRE
jgi:hypothetical protein